MVMGVNPWKSRLELWNEKVTQQATIDATKQLMFKVGHTLEPIIAEEYTKETGRELEERPLKVHPKYPFILGNVDREIIDVADGRGPGILEIKTKGAFTNWHSEEIPFYYLVQLQHYLALYNYSWGGFAVLDLGVMRLNIVDIERDDELINRLIKEEVDFWNLVEFRVPPKVDNSIACQEFLREKYKVSEDITIDISNNEDAKKWAAMLKEAKRNIKAFDIIETEAKNHLMSIVGNAEKAVGNNFSISWKAPRDKEVFDLERFKLEHAELAKRYIKSEPQTRRFFVRYIEEDKNKDTKKEKDKQIEGGKKKGDKKEVIQIDNSGLKKIKAILDEEL
jgi:putative phage-type endonuclease